MLVMLEATHVFKRLRETSMMCLWEGTVALESSDTCWKGSLLP